MAKRMIASLSLGVLVYRSVRAVDSGSVDAAGLPVYKAEVTTSTAAMPDPAVIPPQARKALEGTRRESLPFGVVAFVLGDDDAPVAEAQTAPEAPAKARKAA